jgi:hypothetical protein
MAYVGILTCNLLGVPLHQCIMLLVTESIKSSNTRTTSPEELVVTVIPTPGKEDNGSNTKYTAYAAICILISSWGMFTSSWINYIPSVYKYFGQYPAFVAILTISLPLAFIAFGVAASWFYIWVLWNLLHEIPITETDTKKYLKYLATAFDTFSIIIKLSAVFIIVGSDQFGPTASCK